MDFGAFSTLSKSLGLPVGILIIAWGWIVVNNYNKQEQAKENTNCVNCRKVVNKKATTCPYCRKNPEIIS